MKIKYVNGFKIRNTIDPDFGGHMTSDYALYRYIPRGEVWVEDYLKPEIDLFLNLVKIEQQFFRQKKSFSELHDFVKKEVCEKSLPPNFYKKTSVKDKLKIVEVDGRVVRRYLDPYFVGGGHDLIYDYIPKKEVWIDARNYKEDQSFVLIHELFERQLMAKGRDYLSAHDFALAEEKHQRRLMGVADFVNG